MASYRIALLSFGPIAIVIVGFLGIPLAFIFEESIRAYTPGGVGSSPGAPLTVHNYTELFSSSYARFFWTTYWLGIVCATLSVLIAFPIAYYLARTKDSVVRNLLLGLLIIMMFVSALVRVYSLELTFGTVGVVRPVMQAFSINMNSRVYLEALVVAGLLHLSVPIAALTLIGTVQNINPRLAEAAQTLGASSAQAHLSITVPLCIQGLLSAFLLSFSLSVSAFVIPWILGKGRVLFVSNLIYSRFSEIANYPSGAALSVAMLIISFICVYVLSQIPRRVDASMGGDR